MSVSFRKRLTKPKASVSIVLSKDTVSLGNELRGTVNVTSEEEFDADEIRVEVTGVAPNAIPGGEDSPPRDKMLWLITERVSGPLHFRQGFRQEFPLSVMIPVSPCFKKYGMPSRGITTRILGWLVSPGLHVAGNWLQKHPEWRGKIIWAVRGVVAVKGRRDVTTQVDFTVPLPPLTLEEKESIRKKAKFHAAAVFFGLPLILIGLYLREVWAFERMEIWGPIFVIGLLLFMFGLPGLLPRIKALRTKKNSTKS